jgi:hypothetical protein
MKEKKSRNKIEELYADFQDVLLVAILFFISQMSIVNTILRQYFINLGIYDTDGNFNIKGMIFKSVIFSLIYGVIFKSGDKVFPI